MLCAPQGACAHFGHSESGHAPLLSYAELGAEISLTRIALDGVAGEAQDREDVAAVAP